MYTPSVYLFLKVYTPSVYLFLKMYTPSVYLFLRMHTPSVYLFLRMHTPSVYLFLSLHTTCCRACIDSPCPQLMLPVVEPQTTAHMDIDSEEASVPWHHQLMAIGETSFTMLHHASPSFTICYHSSPSDTI